MRFVDYFRLQVHRMGKLLPGIGRFLIILLSILVVGGSVFLVKNKQSDSTTQKYKIGAVGDLSTPYISGGMMLLQNFDDSKYMFDIIPMSQSEAERGLRNGEITLYIVIPDGFENAIDYGTDDLQLTFYASNGQRGITSIFMEGLAGMVSEAIVDCQAGIFGMMDVYSVNIGGYSQQEVDMLFLKYMTMLLDRGDFSNKKIIGFSDRLRYYDYYFCTLLLFFLFLISLAAIAYFATRHTEFLQVLKSRGFNGSKQVVGEYLVYLIFFWVVEFITFVVLSVLTHFKIIDLLFIEQSTFVYFLVLFFKLIPVSIMISAFQFFICEVLIGMVSQIMTQFIICVGMCYFSGYFYPREFFPELIIGVGKLLPTGCAFDYLRLCIMENLDFVGFFKVFAYAVIFLILACVIRNVKLNKCVHD